MLTVQISKVQDCDVMPYLVSQSNFSCAHVWNLGCAMRCLYFSGPAMAEAEIFKNCSGFREELITTVACARGSTATTCCVILLIVLVVLTILVIRQKIKGSRVWNHRETPINNLANCCHSSVRTYPSSKS